LGGGRVNGILLTKREEYYTFIEKYLIYAINELIECYIGI
jgi:hypothetical protein